jgi:hypothetical protein
MLQFKVHNVRIRGRQYVLLPKLNPEQMEVLSDRLAREGFVVRDGTSIVAESRKRTIHIEPTGLCWSAADPSDYVLPLLPDLLGRSSRARPEAVLGAYLNMVPVRGGFAIHLSPRLESMGFWDDLRRSGGCGLSPDERLVIQCVLDGADGKCSIVTDFPVEGSEPMVVGRRRYFLSNLAVAEVSRSIRAVGEPGRKSSYLPRDGVLMLSKLILEEESVAKLAEELGEWWSFRVDW